MHLVFVFMVASGSIFYQPQSEVNCLKLAAAFANGEQVTAKIKGEEVPILQGTCLQVEDEADFKLLRTIAIEWAAAS